MPRSGRNLAIRSTAKVSTRTMPSMLLRLTLLLAALTVPAVHAQGAGPPAIVEVEPLPVTSSPLVVELDPSVARDLKGSRILVSSDTEPVGWLTPVDNDADQVRFRSGDQKVTAQALASSRCWLIRASLTRGGAGRWPDGADLIGRLLSTGPGASYGWLSAGAFGGVSIGDAFWLRRFGQPIARFDVRFAGPDSSYGRITPLVAGIDLPPDAELLLWPPPADRAAGRLASAVSFVEPGDGDTWIWVALPPHHDGLPAEPRVEFHRKGRYIGFGTAERRDGRFWYVRLLRAASVETPAVGDDVIVRTPADIRDRRFNARVFASAPEGFLVSAGEGEKIGVGDEATVFRSAVPLGKTRVTKVQGGYAVVLDLPGAAAGEGIRVLDEVSFAGGATTSTSSEPVLPPRPLATIERVVGADMLSVRVIDPDTACGELLPIRNGRNTVGVGVLIMRDGERCVAIAVRDSLREPLASGMQLFSTK